MTYSATSSIVINASREAVWDALTKPEQVKEYFFGTNMQTTWAVGSPIMFTGEWEGKLYEDKGTVLEYTPVSTLSYSYWSPLSGIEDTPDAYQIIKIDLEEAEEGTKVSLSQSNVATQEKADHSAENWKMVLEGLRKYVESKQS